MGSGRDFSCMKNHKKCKRGSNLFKVYIENSHLERFPSLDVPSEHMGGERGPLQWGHGQLRFNELVMLDGSHADNI